MFDIEKETNGFESELKALRRDFHENPEIGFKEFRTSKVIYDYLKKLDIDVKNIAKTGVVGVLKGTAGEGKTILLRANMDASPVDEKTDLEFSSKNEGIMHASGHDGQLATLLVVAKMLSRHKTEFKGSVKFIFQPNEEGAGAVDMINEGILENPDVDAALALAFTNDILSGHIGLSSGVVLGVTEEFEIELFGKSANTSAPHKGKDAILTASKIIDSLQLLVSREYNPLYPIAIMIGRICGGKARNFIADKVNMGGTIRFLFPDGQSRKEEVMDSVERVVKSVCELCSMDYKIRFITSNPSLYNNPELVKMFKECAEKIFVNSDSINEHRGLMGEDFAEISLRVPSVMAFLGIYNESKGLIYPMYHPKFNIDEEVMKYGARFLVSSVLRFLNE